MSLSDWIGSVGVALLLGAFFLNLFGFLGHTTRAYQLTHALGAGLAWDPQGSGRVVRQDPPPGTPVEDVSLCQLAFAHLTGGGAAAPDGSEDDTGAIRTASRL